MIISPRPSLIRLLGCAGTLVQAAAGPLVNPVSTSNVAPSATSKVVESTVSAPSAMPGPVIVEVEVPVTVTGPLSENE